MCIQVVSRATIGQSVQICNRCFRLRPTKMTGTRKGEAPAANTNQTTSHVYIFVLYTHIYCNFVIVITRATVMQRIDHYTTVHSIWRRNSFRLHLCSATTIEAYASRLCDGHPRQHICLEDQIHRTNSTHCSKYSIVQLSAPCKSCKSKGTYNNDFSKSCNT